MYQLHTSQHSHFFSSTTLWPKRPLNWRKLPSKCFYVAFYIKKSVIICISDLNYDTHNWFMWCRGANLFLFQFDVKLSNISSWLNWSFAIFRVQLVVTFTFFLDKFTMAGIGKEEIENMSYCMIFCLFCETLYNNCF